jgi:hypothetical protein
VKTSASSGTWTLKRPAGLYKKFMDDRTFARLWFSDLRYYKACELFSGRMPPDFSKLSRFTANLST